MHARGRTPDFIVLSQAREADASTGTNAREIELLGIASAVITLGHADQRSIATLVDRLLRRPQPPATPEAD
jgi:hypothetical protein